MTDPPLARALRALAVVARHTAGLVVPLVCPCGREGSIPCPECAAALSGPAVRVDGACAALQVLIAAEAGRGAGDCTFAPVLPVLALGAHAGALRHQVLAWKNGGMLCLAEPFAAGLEPAVRSLARVEPARSGGPAPSRPSATDDVVLVPVPSSTVHRLRRGEDHTAELARALGRRCRIEVVGALHLRGGTQIGKDQRQRRSGRDGRMRLVRRPDPGVSAVLVDDVVTTGATLRAAHDVLAAHGVPVRGAVVVAAARLPRSVRVPGPGAPPDLRED